MSVFLSEWYRMEPFIGIKTGPICVGWYGHGLVKWSQDVFVLHWPCWKSTHLLGIPLFLGTTTILLHQVVGSPTGTSSNTPILKSLSIAAIMASFQWIGTGNGL